jgi:hypothetical protein
VPPLVCIGYESFARSFINTEGLLSSDGKTQKPPVQIHQHQVFSSGAGLLMPKRSVLSPNVAGTVRAAISAGLISEWERQNLRVMRLATISTIPQRRKKLIKRSQQVLMIMMTMKIKL